jgi:DNA polymerase
MSDADHDPPVEAPLDPRDELRALTTAVIAHADALAVRGVQRVPARPLPRSAPAVEPRTEPAPPAPTPLAPPEPTRPQVARGAEGLDAIRAELGDCQRCKLARGRVQLVYGQGDPGARLMFVGEGPGRDEDLSGEPFVGAAGALLTRMIQAMGLSREAVYIANVVKCRPPENRDPEPDEIALCLPFLLAQIEAVAPDVIVTLGRPAAQSLLRTSESITRMRGSWRTLTLAGREIRVMPTFHPAYLLRNAEAKRPAWEDLKQVMAALRGLGHLPPAGSPGVR